MRTHIIGFLLLVTTHTGFALDRTSISDTADGVTPLLNGQSIPDIAVKTVDGAPVSIQALVLSKPTVFVFYRGGWCPYCSRQLAGLKDIEQDLLALEYQVVAISPESPTRLQAQKFDSELTVTRLSDESLEAIRGFGVGFYVDESTRDKYRSRMGISLTEDDTGRAVLPVPAVYIVDTDGTVLFNYVNPDYSVRLSSELLLHAATLLR